jgi:hypothetical protein
VCESAGVSILTESKRNTGFSRKTSGVNDFLERADHPNLRFFRLPAKIEKHRCAASAAVAEHGRIFLRFPIRHVAPSGSEHDHASLTQNQIQNE